MRETRLEYYTRKKFFKEISEDIVVSFSLQEYLKIINSHLREIYGDRADWERNLRKYYSSKPYQDRCVEINRVDDIPTLSIRGIKEMIKGEESYNKKMADLISLLPAFESSESAPLDTVMKAAAIIGLTQHTGNELYQHFVDLDNLSADEWQVIVKKIESNIARFTIAVKMIIRLLMDCRLITYPVLETVMTQQRRKNYYRGENAFYGSSKPSEYRNFDQGEPDWIVGRLNEIKRNEAGQLLDQIHAVTIWGYSNVNYLALMQHYGLRTPMIDVTSDIWMALFFATCKYDSEAKGWRPLRKSEFSKKDSRRSIYRKGGDSRFAVLYRQPSEIVEMKWLFVEDDNIDGMIFPVGYQPFMRCAAQSAYGLLSRDNKYDLYGDKQFEKYKIRLTEDLCEWVFESTDRGKSVYPYEDIPDIGKYFDAINTSKVISRRVFENILTERKIERTEWLQYEKDFAQYGYAVSDSEFQVISPEQCKIINRSYTVPYAKSLLYGKMPYSDPLIITLGKDERSK